VTIEEADKRTSGAKSSDETRLYRSAQSAAPPKSHSVNSKTRILGGVLQHGISRAFPNSPQTAPESPLEKPIHYYSGVRRALQLTAFLSSGLLPLGLSGCYSGTRPPRIGSNAPDFTVQDGQNKITLSQYRGQVVVLNFWATWCPPCVEEMPSLVEMQRRMKAKGVTVLAVSVDVDESAYKQFVKDHNVNLLTVRDPDQKSNSLYGTSKFPETYIIDRNGVMQRKFIGAVDWTEPEVVDFLGKL
jgi:peroxiredoxin